MLTQNYCELRSVLARSLGRRLYLSPSEFEELYQDAWREVVRRHRRGQPIYNYQRFLTGVMINLWKMELRSRRRHPTVPLEDVREHRQAEPPAGDRLETHEAARLALEVIESLANPRHRQILKLRLAGGLSTGEVQQSMRVTERTYRRLLTEAMHEVERKLELVEAGTWCADRRDLLIAYAQGRATEQQAEQAQRHLAACVSCRNGFPELRRASRRVTHIEPVFAA